LEGRKDGKERGRREGEKGETEKGKRETEVRLRYSLHGLPAMTTAGTERMERVQQSSARSGSDDKRI